MLYYSPHEKAIFIFVCPTLKCLSCSPSKSVAVMFTNRRKWTKHPIHIGTEEIPFKNEGKYLGVILDSKLSGISHVKHRLGKAKRHLMTFIMPLWRTMGLTQHYWKGPTPPLYFHHLPMVVIFLVTNVCKKQSINH